MSPAATLVRLEWIRGIVAVSSRYSIATIGPLSVSAANFLASLALLRVLPPAEFGLLAFLLIVVGFCYGLSNALVGTPYTVASNRRDFKQDDLRTFFKANLLLSFSAGLVCCGIAFVMNAHEAAPLFGFFGFFATMRWFARAHAYAIHAPKRVAVVDIVYAVLLLAGLTLTWFFFELTLDTALVTFVVATAAAVVAFGRGYLKTQFIEAFGGSLKGYGQIWQNQSRWTLLGVASTEATLNAHSYLVTLIAGPAAFAPLAAASLFIRPIPMCANSLMQLERPAMARAIDAGDMNGALRMARHFRWALMLVWAGTITASAVILVWFPSLILTKSYDVSTVMAAVALAAVIEGIQSWIQPDSALLQASNRFRILASATVRSSFVAIAAAFVLLLGVGPVASLGGVLLGEITLALYIISYKYAWSRGA